MLHVENLRKSYLEANGHPLPILEIPEFRLAAGQQMAMLGRSGCGKSTFLHILAGITRSDAGSVRIDDVDITRLSESGRDRFRATKIGYVFQTFNLLPAFTALENVVLGMTFSRGNRNRARAGQLLDRVGLLARAHHKPRALSVGEQQRVAVARALANQPRLLLADEPTANVDPENQQRIVDLIRQSCREEKVALLLVTHAPEVAEQFERVDRLEELNQVLHRAPASAGRQRS